MNPVIKFSFSEWLAAQEPMDAAARVRAPMEDLSHIDQVSQLIGTGDVVDLSSERTRKGESQNLGLVQDVSGKRAVVVALHDPGRPVEIQFSSLYLMDPDSLPPAQRVSMMRDITRMRGEGGRDVRLWQKRTARQRQMDLRRRSREEKEREKQIAAMQPAVPMTPDISPVDVQKARAFLLGGEGEPETAPREDPFASLFAKEKGGPGPKQPLAGFMRGKRARSELDALLQKAM